MATITFSFEAEEKEIKKIRSVLKTFGVRKLKVTEDKPSKELIDRVKQAREDFANGKLISVNPDNIWENIV